MAHPFIPFPIFPGYSFWLPNGSQDLPANENVRAHLEAVDPAAQPFICTWYCSQYLQWRLLGGINSVNYRIVVRNLESMLLWSFAHKTPLLDWDELQLDKFRSFCVNPPKSWTNRSPLSKYVVNRLAPFSVWAINKEWRPFSRGFNGDGSLGLTVAGTHLRLLAEVRRFFDFYRSITSSKLPNPAAKALLRPSGLPKRLGTSHLSVRQMDWLFKFALEYNQPPVKVLEVAVILGFARWTSLSMDAIMGSPENPSSFDQFKRDGDSQWRYSPSAGLDIDSWHTLPITFTPLLDSYLLSMGINPLHPLPAKPLFPLRPGGLGCKADTAFGHITSFGISASHHAHVSEDEEVKQGVAKFQKLNFSMVRRSAKPSLL